MARKHGAAAGRRKAQAAWFLREMRKAARAKRRGMTEAPKRRAMKPAKDFRVTGFAPARETAAPERQPAMATAAFRMTGFRANMETATAGAT